MKHRKTWIRNTFIILGAILFYCLTIYVTNAVVSAQQAAFLKREAQSYRLIKDDTVDLKQWLAKSQLTVVTLKGDSNKFRDTGRDLISHNLISRNDPIAKQTVSNQTYLVYGAYTTVGNPTLFFMPKDDVWDYMPATFWLLSIIYFAGWSLGLLWNYRRQKQMRMLLDTLVANVQRIRHQDNPEPLILDTHSSLYPLSVQVNKLEQDMGHLQDKVTIRSESFSSLIEHLPMGVMLIDMDGNVQLINASMQTLLQTQEAPLPHPFIDDVKTYRLSQMIEHTIRNQHNQHGEVQLVQQPARYVDANVIQLGQDGPKPQILVLLYDLTDMRRIEQMQLDFVGNVSHELKTPVTAISGFAETLTSDPSIPEDERQKFLQIIYKESQRLNQLIQDILELSKLDDKGDEQPKDINVRQSIQSILTELAPAIEAQKLQVDLNGKDDVGIEMDPTQFHQIMKNLISNAIYYNKPEGSIAINFAQGTHNIHLSVADTGIGLKAEEQERIFERFYRVDKARSYNNGGTGLGLAIVRSIVENNGGQLSVSSQYGVGSTFNVQLPRS